MATGIPHVTLANLMVELSKHEPSTPVVALNLTTGEAMFFRFGTGNIIGGEHDGLPIITIGVNAPTSTPTEDGL